ncbi:MAG: DNA gyrase/topoisomerase IV subunit A, partial [Flavobacteriales bacterium]
MEHVVPLSGMYEEWFLDYASYVILERAVPLMDDGLKPVQRRILHAMQTMDDGRYNKVANIIGESMKYHPHGDASIGEALVQLGQKELLIDTQGNWGNLLTGDKAAAPRYIEARLSEFAKEVCFNKKITEWQLSYDGRNYEPIALPVKFPLLLAQGVEGIAVGLACRILPHNFNELLDASIDILKGKSPELYPDFPAGGLIEVDQYNDGKRGGRVRVRARIQKDENRSLTITEIPYGTTTSSLIDSIVKANEKGKIKIRKVEDNTAEEVEVKVHLPTGVSPDKTIDALYAFTDCQNTLHPNATVIDEGRPRFIGISDILHRSTERSVELLREELQIRKDELEEQWHFASLEKIFIEERIYREIEECETWEAVLSTIREGLKPFQDRLKRAITEEDIVRLTEIRIKRISKYDSFQAEEKIKDLENRIADIDEKLAKLTDYAIDHFRYLKKKYGKGMDRKSEIRQFDTIEASKVTVANKKLYVNWSEGFIGHGMRKEGEYVRDCSDIDNIIVFRNDGCMLVTQVDSKKFVGKGIRHVSVWKRGDERSIYHMVYADGKDGPVRIKRFNVPKVTRDREYDLTRGKKGSRVLYLSENPNGRTETLEVTLKPKPRLKKLKFQVDVGEYAIKSRNAQGNILSKH